MKLRSVYFMTLFTHDDAALYKSEGSREKEKQYFKIGSTQIESNHKTHNILYTAKENVHDCEHIIKER